MAENTKIEWCDRTWSPWEGCQKVGPGCDNCYAEARNNRFHGGNWGPGAPRRMTSDAGYAKMFRWDREAAERGEVISVFPSLCDPFDNAAPSGARERFANVIKGTPNLRWLLLTKRIGNAPDMLAEMFDYDIPPNVFVGATIVNQDEWQRDASKIAQVAVLIGKSRIFLSMEPLLSEVNLSGNSRYQWAGIVGWVIVGGESGLGARPIHPDWARSLRDQCAAADVPFLFKQWGEWVPGGHPAAIALAPLSMIGAAEAMTKGGAFPDGQTCWHVGKKAAGRLLDGQTHDGVPA